MRKNYSGTSFLLFTSALALLLLTACTTEQMRVSPTLAVFNTSAYSPDGKIIAAGRNAFNVVFLYDGSTVRFRKALTGKLDNTPLFTRAHALSFSGDSRFLAAAGIDKMLVMWDLSGDQSLMSFPDLRDALALSFSPIDYKLAVSNSRNGITLLEIPENRGIGELIGHTAPVIAISFSPDGKLLATGGTDNTVRLWDVGSLQQIKIFDGYELPVHSVSFSPDGALLATYSGNQIKIWQLKDKGVQDVVIPKTGNSGAAPILLLLVNAESISSGRGALFSPSTAKTEGDVLAGYSGPMF